MNREIYLLTCPLPERGKPTSPPFFYVQPLRLERIATALSIFPSFMPSLGSRKPPATMLLIQHFTTGTIIPSGMRVFNWGFLAMAGCWEGDFVLTLEAQYTVLQITCPCTTLQGLASGPYSTLASPDTVALGAWFPISDRRGIRIILKQGLDTVDNQGSQKISSRKRGENHRKTCLVQPPKDREYQ